METSLDLEFCQFCGSQGQDVTTSDLVQRRLKEILPMEFVYKICSFHFQPEVTNQPEVTHFKTTLRTKFASKEEVMDWKDKFESQSLATFRCTQTFPKSGKKNVFKEYFHCQHSSLRLRDKSKSKKNTECKATLSVIVKRCVKYSRSSDTHLPEWPTKIDISWIHNHPINSAGALKYRDVSEETKKKLCTLFTKGHTPSTALDMLKSDLQLSLGDDYVFAAGDRGLVPDPSFVYRLQAKQYRSSTEGHQQDTSVGIGSRDVKDISWEILSEPMSVDDGDDETRDNDNTARLALALEKFDSFTDTVKNKLQSDPQSFLPALEAFVKSFDNTKTDSGLISALHSFGKYSGIQSTKQVVTSKRISIQPTAISRRRQRLFGKQITRAGRPIKKSVVGPIIPSTKSFHSREILRAIIPRRKAPHNLASCVGSNESLGKTHSAK